MPEFRKDPILGRWVIVAANRADRPNAFIASPPWDSNAACPFCEGREDQTPEEVLAYRAAGSAANGPGWRVRVVPNKFPALEMEAGASAGLFSSAAEAQTAPKGTVPFSLRRKWGQSPLSPSLYEMRPAFGAHEVVIESPEHVANTSELGVGRLAEVFAAYRERLLAWRCDPRLVHPLVFKNVGRAAGASLEHAHSQMIALPMVPSLVRQKMAGAAEFFDRHGRCVWCEMVSQEQAAGSRTVVETPRFFAFAPFASTSPFEVWIVPKVHASHFDRIDPAELAEVADVVSRVVGAIEAVLDRPAYNYVLQTSPFDTAELGHYHWHIEIVPSVTKTAGFEWGSGYFINPVAPEEAAATLVGQIANLPF